MDMQPGVRGDVSSGERLCLALLGIPLGASLSLTCFAGRITSCMHRVTQFSPVQQTFFYELSVKDQGQHRMIISGTGSRF